MSCQTHAVPPPHHHHPTLPHPQPQPQPTPHPSPGPPPHNPRLSEPAAKRAITAVQLPLFDLGKQHCPAWLTGCAWVGWSSWHCPCWHSRPLRFPNTVAPAPFPFPGLSPAQLLRLVYETVDANGMAEASNVHIRCRLVVCPQLAASLVRALLRGRIGCWRALAWRRALLPAAPFGMLPLPDQHRHLAGTWRLRVAVSSQAWPPGCPAPLFLTG